MELNAKIQALRKQKGLTQEELAQALYVSRTAVSKWESGRGYPGLESLRALAKFFGVTIDELLSGDELLTVAEEDARRREERTGDLFFGLMDCSSAMLLFLPLFRQKAAQEIRAVLLLSLDAALYFKAACLLIIAGIIALGVLTLGHWRQTFWRRNKRRLSLAAGAAGALLCVMGLQPYAAAFLLIFMAIKALMLVNRP